MTHWTLCDAAGFIAQQDIDVETRDDGTTRIGATLHRTDDLVITDHRITSKNAGWSLER